MATRDSEQIRNDLTEPYEIVSEIDNYRVITHGFGLRYEDPKSRYQTLRIEENRAMVEAQHVLLWLPEDQVDELVTALLYYKNLGKEYHDAFAKEQAREDAD